MRIYKNDANRIYNMNGLIIRNNCLERYNGENVFNDCFDITVYASAGGTAEQYAKENNINFKEK